MADEYLTEALDLMEEHSVRRLEIDWPSFREDTRADADGAQTTSDTYPALHAAVERLGDDHSRFHEPGSPSASVLSTASALRGPASSETGPDGARGGRLGESVGYVAVPGFQETSNAAMTRYATDLQRVIREADAEGVCAWIVDLRGNGGGNMWPMLAGVGPLLGDGDAGAFVDPEGDFEVFFYEAGGAGTRAPDGTGANVIAEVDGAPYRPTRDPVLERAYELVVEGGGCGGPETLPRAPAASHSSAAASHQAS